MYGTPQPSIVSTSPGATVVVGTRTRTKTGPFCFRNIRPVLGLITISWSFATGAPDSSVPSKASLKVREALVLALTTTPPPAAPPTDGPNSL